MVLVSVAELVDVDQAAIAGYLTIAVSLTSSRSIRRGVRVKSDGIFPSIFCRR